jgi:Sec8 exocyst complex component specific domain
VQLKQELDRCERVIDAVVDAHHLGFNHAIENYSKILSLFNECKSQVRG